MATDSTALALLLGKVKSWQPVSLRVQLADGEWRDVEIQQVRRRWVKLEATLSQMEWVRVEGLSKKGAIVGVFENPDYEAGEDSSLEDLGANQLTGQVAGLVGIMLRAQDTALKRMGDEHKLVLDQCLRVIEVLTKRNDQLERSYAQNVSMVQGMLKKMGATAAEGEEWSSGDALGALAMAWMQSQLPAGAMPQPPHTPPNGKGGE